MSEHQYLSTACFHEEHEACRLTCKFCVELCNCPCHQVVAHAPDGQVKTEGDL